jgi:hypothetical protein
MTALFFIISILSALIYFGIIKRLNEKWLEIVHFSAVYLVLLFVFQIVFCFVQKMNADPQYWSFEQCVRDAIIVSALFFILPGFTVAWLLYPFKIIKRSKVLIWILSATSILIAGIATFIEIAHTFSNM